jgi:Leucine-rich repeat (LRR) protein
LCGENQSQGLNIRKTTQNIEFKLRALDLYRNNLSSVNKSLFNMLSNLSELFLGHNFIVNLEPYNFVNLTRLEYLDLSQNLLVALSDRLVFMGLKMLKHLDLSMNKIENIYDYAFAELVGLETLNLSSNIINFIGPKAFHGLERLRMLKLHINGLETSSALPEGLFDPLKSIERIELTGIIKEFEPYTFCQLNNMESLTIYLQELDKIPAKTFFNLTMLKSLEIETRNLSIIEKGAFAGLEKLTKLDLSNNKLSNFSHEVFDKSFNHSLKELILSYNKIQCIDREMFKNLSNLEYLDFQNNRIESVEKFAFLNNTNLKNIDLKSNRLHIVDLSGLSERILSIDLTLNSISWINTTSFQNFTSLEFLDLSFNQIESLNNDASSFFSHLNDLRELNLIGNLFIDQESFNLTTLYNLKKLRYLSLYFEEPSLTYFRPFDHLTELRNGDYYTAKLEPNMKNLTYLQMNLLEAMNTIESKMFESMAKLKTIETVGWRNELNTIEKLAFSDLKSLTQIKFTQLFINSVETCAFFNLSSLIELNLTNLLISNLAENSFCSLQNLKTIDLSKNRLSNLSKTVFDLKTRTQLKSLIVSWNRLKSFPDLTGLTNLEYLDLHGNFIQTIESNLIQSLTHSLKVIDLSQNRLKSFEFSNINLSVFVQLEALNLCQNSMYATGEMCQMNFNHSSSQFSLL